jgi:O-antigen ligase
MRARADLLILLAGLSAVLLVRDASLTVPFTLPKLLAIEVFVASLAILYAIRAARGRLHLPPRSVVVPLALLVALWMLSTFTAVDSRTAILGAYTRGLGLIAHLAFAGVFLFIASAGRAHAYGFSVAFVAALVPVAVVAVLQQGGVVPMGFSGDAQLDLAQHPQTRPYGTIGHPVPFAALLALGVPIAAAILLRQRSSAARWIVAGLLLLFAAASAMSLSRGPWIGTAVAILMVAAAAHHEGLIHITRRRVAAIGVALGVCLLTLLGPTVISRIAQRAATLVSGDASSTNRLAYAGTALRIARDHPYTGGGFDSFALLYPRYRPSDAPGLPVDALPTMVHNGYLHIVATNGAPALVAYLALVAIILLRLRTAWRDEPTSEGRMLAVALAAAIVGFLVQDMTGWEELPVTLAFWAVLGLAASFGGGTTRVRGTQTSRYASAIVSSAVAVVMLAGAAETLRAIDADRSLAQAHRMVDAHAAWSDARTHIADAVRTSRFHPHVESAAGVLYLQRFATTRDIGEYRTAAQLFRDAARQNPHGPYALIHRIDLESQALALGVAQSVSPEVEALMARLERLDPSNPTAHATIARLRLAQGHPAEALAAIRRAGRLSELGRRRYAIYEGDALRALGDREGALEAYRRGVSVTTPAYPEWLILKRRVVLLLFELGANAVAEAEAAALLRMVDDPQTRYALDAIHSATR